MAMNAQKLSNDIVISIRERMQQISSGAIPTDFQEEIAKAVAGSVIANLKIAKTIGVAPVPAAIGKGSGLIVNAQLMTAVAFDKMRSFTGTSGIATLAYINAIMTPIQKHLQSAVEIQSISGYGGQGGPPVGVAVPLLQALIIAKLPAQTKAALITSIHGINFIESLSTGIHAGLLVGIPGLVPFTPPGPDITVVILIDTFS